MELNKKNFNSILNNLIAGVTLVLASILIALCFISPYSKVRAVTKEDINAYNIYFVSALTKARTATGINRVQMKGINSNNNSYSFYSYQYNYNDYTNMQLYYGRTNTPTESGNALIMHKNSSDTPQEEIIYSEATSIPYDRSNSGFIPYGVNYYNNIEGEKEEIFYNEIDNGDYVLINNYDNYPSDNTAFNVENFYLSFGTPYIDDMTTTPLSELRVVAKLYSGDQVHNLALNDVNRSNITEGQSNAKYAEYWSQYLDLRNLNAYETSDPSSPLYAVENQQGKYEFTFYFIRYDKELKPISESEEEFKYTFYLLDSADYTQYPTIYNAEIKEDNLENGAVTEYYYNYSKENPYINYDPTKYNISYTRVNNKSVNNVAENITSTFVEGSYTKDDDGINYPKGIISYLNGNNIIKQIFVLTYFNDDQSVVEHLYLSRTNPTNTSFNPSTYQAFIDALEENTLVFEYKITKVLTGNVSEYQINEYKTTTYNNLGFIADKFVSVDSTNLSVTLDDNTTTAFDKEVLDNSYNITTENTGVNTPTLVKRNGSVVATFENYPKTNNVIDKLVTAAGIILNNKTLEESGTMTDDTCSTYQLTSTTTDDNTSEKTYTLTKKYKTLISENTYNDKTVDIPISITGAPVNSTISMLDPENNQITIEYIITEDAVSGEKSISSITFSLQNSIEVTSISTNQYTLQNIIGFENYKLNLDYTYNLELDELGIYEFKYSYVCPADNNKYFINSTSTASDSNYYSGSTNYTTPINYSTQKESISSSTPSTLESKLYAVISANIENTKFTLLGKNYIYNLKENNFTEENDSTAIYNFNINCPLSVNASDTANTYFTISNSSVVRLYIEIGTKSQSTINITTPYTIHGKNGFRSVINSITTTTYTLSFASINISDPNLKELQDAVKLIESYTPHESEDKTFVQTSNKTSYAGSAQGVDKMHIFGSIAYFNKLDSYSDSNYSKLEQIDSKLALNYVSDVTSLYLTKATSSDYGNLGYIEGTSSLDASNFKGKISTLLKKDEIIITDVTPVLWNNFSTLAYNGKRSYSYVYRYSKYTTDTNGYIEPIASSLISSTYTKDIYCQFDGLYEVVVFYTYDNLPDDLRGIIYYQLFTFIIDNSSPSINIEIEKEPGIYEELGLNLYTNKDIRISWKVPSYFQNDVYLEINKEYYNNTNTQYNYNAIYKANNINTTSGNSTYVNAVSDMNIYERTETDGSIKKYYYVDLKVKDTNSVYDINGNYTIVVHYSTNGKSTFSERFVIDKQNISGLSLESVIKNTDGSYQVNQSVDLGLSQIVNTDFTFRFNRKDSKANIFVYYDKIDLVSSSDFDQIVEIGDQLGITTNYKVNGVSKAISTGTPYNYEYTHETDPNYVSSKNLLTSSASCIYLFRLQDEAGNEARFIVFYDTTAPRFITSPEPDTETHIVNDTTRVVWGNYKAIKVDADDGFEIANNNNVTNYTKEDETNKLSLVLRYLNSSNNRTLFNNLKVEKVDNNYYILVPVTNIKVADNEYGHEFNFDPTSDSSSYKDYYFFPTNPIETVGTTNYITLPDYDNNGKILTNSEGAIEKTRYEVASYNIENITNYNNENVARYITIAYYPIENDKTITLNITGAIGEGQYIYSVYDDLNNKTSGLLWMNLDKTQTLAYGLFDYSDKLANAQALTGSSGTYSASKLFISSLVATEKSQIPDYTVTYKHYAYDASLYKDFAVTGIELLTDDINTKETYLRLSMAKKTDSTITKVVDVQLTDEDGNEYPRYSYPYSLDGRAIIADANGNPLDVYSNGSQFKGKDTSRKYSLAINTTTDTNRQSTVTEEGLYIFKRTYTDTEISEATLGTDSRIIYRIYYIDRSGIINISASNSVASTLYNVGENINFTLGSTYSLTDYQKEVTAKSIQNNQSAVASNNSNANYISQNIFDTNKIQVEFNLTYDKYDFMDSISNYKSNIENLIKNKSITEEEKTYLNTLISNTIFNQRYFENNYKIELTLSVGASVIIDEAEDYYSTTGINYYLKNNPMVDLTTRGNQYNFFLDTLSNAYIVGMNDQAGYVKYNSDNTINDANYLANNLDISFNISHTAPVGDFYGKYYGRHDYDENKSSSDKPLSVPSIPYENGAYAILKYLQNGQLDPLSDSSKYSSSDLNGNYVKLYSTNNETLIFTFSITNDEYQAQIDPNNIRIYKDSIAQNNLIFNRVNGDFVDTSLVSRSRQSHAFIRNDINGITHYVIIIFDNNLDEIVDADEKDYLNYRLLDPKDNIDSEDYFIQINYVGNSDDYIGQDNNANQISFYQTTYEISIDRIKPTYNLTKLMNLDKYVYNTVNTSVTTTNYEDVFESYKPFYNFETDKDYNFDRSDLENYFFALDTRQNSSFVFESISELDNNNNFYIREIDNKDNYKFSVTPDDYEAYYNAVYLQGHPQFTPSNATTVTSIDFESLTPNQYYRIPFSLDGDASDGISANFLKNFGIFNEDRYYEIIEEDEAGNYRVYAVYIPQESADKIIYSYQTTSDESSAQSITILYGNTPYIESNGMALKFTTIQTKDNFLKATINVATNKIDHDIEVILDPNNLTVTIINRTLGNIMNTYQIGSRDKNGYTNTDEFIVAINEVLDYYYRLINDKNHTYYSEYGYNVEIKIINRIGVSMKDSSTLYNYEIDYVVAGSTLSPIFTNYATNFTMKLEGQKGSTYLTDITVYKFNKVWSQINIDNSTPPQIFDKSIEELKKQITYTFTRGIYKFVFTDNFNRKNEFFYEYGISSSQTGGNLSYSGNYSTSSDGYTYSGNNIVYTYDSSVYNVYIKFTGRVPDKLSPGEYQNIADAQNFVVFNSGQPYTEEQLKPYGITVITSGNTTTITFSGVKDNSKNSGITDLSKYHIKTILASTSTNYTWGDETTNKDIFVYDKKIAIYNAIPNASIKNLSGNTLDTSEHLNLTEDFELVIAWPNTVISSERFDFNPRIILTRTYNDNGNVEPKTTIEKSGKIITQPGKYEAYVINDLGTRSTVISFTRGEGEISMYAVYAVDKQVSAEGKLTPSSLISTETLDTENKVLFTYFITDDYFSYKDTASNITITKENLIDYTTSETLSTDFIANSSANKYIDVRVNSNLSIKTEVFEVGFMQYNQADYPYVKYMIYSTTKTGETYIYRFIQVVFVDKTNTKLANTTILNAGASDVNLAEGTLPITSTAESIYLNFTFGSQLGSEYGLYVPYGDTIYIDRYYNGVFAETISIETSSSDTNIPTFSTTLSQVGLHEFVIRDLAGRTHDFKGNEKLQIYLINEILFTVNDQTPINNQVFNNDVNIDIVFNLSGLQLYTERTLNIVVTKNGQTTNYPNSTGELTLNEAGYYSVTMSAITSENFAGSSTQVSTVYNFVIVDTQIANNTFSISKGTGFAIEKLIKIVNGEETNITDTYKVSSTDTTSSNVLLWLSYAEQGNSIFDVTLRYYDEVSESNLSFNFRIWINNESPVFISSVPAGTSTKDTITINYNPGLIYTQIGKGYITVNDKVVTSIDENSLSFVDTITIAEKGTYWIRLYTQDGTLVNTYKFTKAEPMNSMTKIIIICVAIGIVVIVGLFFFLRRKGRYR